MSVTVRHLSVALAGKTILHDLNVEFPVGKRTAIIGPNGAGKSTLLRVLAALNPKYEGEVLLDGTDIHAIPRKSLAKRLAILPQGLAAPPDLTVEALVDYGRYPYRSWRTIGRSKEDREAVAQALAETRLEAMRTRQVMSLSGGERQRVSIARALLKQAPIVLFDEATSALDAENEANIVKSIEELRKSSTVIAVAHKLETIKMADKIIVLNASGSIEEEGTHDELLALNGAYADFWGKRVLSAQWKLA